MHMAFARICQNSIDFEATFFHQNWVIKRVRNSILHWKLQVILTVLFSNPQNARAVSHLPGCLWSRYIYHQSNWGLLIGGVDGSIKIQLVFGCISIFDNDPKSYSYWKLSYSIAIVRGPPVFPDSLGLCVGFQIGITNTLQCQVRSWYSCLWVGLCMVDECWWNLCSSFIIYFFNDSLINLYICSTMTLFY